MSEDNDDKVGYGRPPEKHRFKPGQSGNPRGRPRRSRRAPTPSQRYKDVLMVADTIMDMKTPAGIRKVTISEAIMFSIAMNAMKGKVAYMKLWLQLEDWAVGERKRRHPTIRLIEMLQNIVEDVRKEPDRDLEEVLDAHIHLMKGRY
ncbi:MAG: hypothetical protein H6895_06185 [Defluviimonas sp.]|uniref:DUF5681 domain-containing protein n=1 Tax=Albidovulum sp. TaxID=1872424 RepID=UPI002A2559A1|nr:hypothetical protein [Defluviimonas sp.]